MGITQLNTYRLECAVCGETVVHHTAAHLRQGKYSHPGNVYYTLDDLPEGWGWVDIGVPPILTCPKCNNQR
jgi:hypothetical protein